MVQDHTARLARAGSCCAGAATRDLAKTASWRARQRRDRLQRGRARRRRQQLPQRGLRRGQKGHVLAHQAGRQDLQRLCQHALQWAGLATTQSNESAPATCARCCGLVVRPSALRGCLQINAGSTLDFHADMHAYCWTHKRMNIRRGQVGCQTPWWQQRGIDWRGAMLLVRNPT